MSRSNNSRKGSGKNKWMKEFWSKRAQSKLTGFVGSWAKKLTSKLERQQQKPKPKDLDE